MGADWLQELKSPEQMDYYGFLNVIICKKRWNKSKILLYKEWVFLAWFNWNDLKFPLRYFFWDLQHFL
jgi:hypothetical protein